MGSTNPNEICVERAIRAALNYIISHQSEEGSWREWELPPGSSSTWATAYIGYRLRCLPSSIKQQIEPRLSLAGKWLLDHIAEDAGWGYNLKVGSDADSTAHAILFLISLGREVPEAAFSHLMQYQSPGGGFSTYRSTGIDDSWTVPHPDVTPVALLAMLGRLPMDKSSLQIGIEYVLKQRTSNYWWNSFWWNSPIYATEANLAFLNTINISSPWPTAVSEFLPKNAFETALLTSSLIYLNPTHFYSSIKSLIGTLIARQQTDGSWNEALILHITRHDCFTPWTSNDPGPLFSDTNRLFTTATVIDALARSLI